MNYPKLSFTFKVNPLHPKDEEQQVEDYLDQVGLFSVEIRLKRGYMVKLEKLVLTNSKLNLNLFKRDGRDVYFYIDSKNDYTVKDYLLAKILMVEGSTNGYVATDLCLDPKIYGLVLKKCNSCSLGFMKKAYKGQLKCQYCDNILVADIDSMSIHYGLPL